MNGKETQIKQAQRETKENPKKGKKENKGKGARIPGKKMLVNPRKV